MSETSREICAEGLARFSWLVRPGGTLWVPIALLHVFLARGGR